MSSAVLLNALMLSVDEIRHANLLFLIRQMPGGQVEFADKTGKNASQVSQWVNRSPDSKTGRPRSMGSDSARSIESALGLAKGWMDTVHDDVANDILRDSLLGSGEAHKLSTGPSPAASQGARPVPAILAQTQQLLEAAYALMGKEFSLVRDPDLFADAYEYLAEDDRPVDSTNLADFGRWLAARQNKGSTENEQARRAAVETPGANRRSA